MAAHQCLCGLGCQCELRLVRIGAILARSHKVGGRVIACVAIISSFLRLRDLTSGNWSDNSINCKSRIVFNFVVAHVLIHRAAKLQVMNIVFLIILCISMRACVRFQRRQDVATSSALATHELKDRFQVVEIVLVILNYCVAAAELAHDLGAASLGRKSALYDLQCFQGSAPLEMVGIILIFVAHPLAGFWILRQHLRLWTSDLLYISFAYLKILTSNSVRKAFTLFNYGEIFFF